MAEASSNSTRPQSARRGHEPDAVSVRWMGSIGLGLFALVVASCAAAAWAFQTFVPHAPLLTTDQESRRELMTPGVEPNQAYGRERIEAAERAALSQYRWQDKERGVAQIPIERAIELMARRKLQVKWPKQEQSESPAPAAAGAEKERK